MNVKINCDSYPGKDFFGKISEIAPTVKERTRTTTIKIDVPNDEGHLRSGMFGRGSIFLMELKNVILVNADSIVSLGDKTFLIPILKPDPKSNGEGLIEMRHVKPGAKTSTGQVIIEDGLLKDELIVTETQGQLTDGLKVKFIETVIEDKPSSEVAGQAQQ
jgi:membrane fusion protein (multidrug efflux system)